MRIRLYVVNFFPWSPSHKRGPPMQYSQRTPSCTDGCILDWVLKWPTSGTDCNHQKEVSPAHQDLQNWVQNPNHTASKNKQKRRLGATQDPLTGSHAWWRGSAWLRNVAYIHLPDTMWLKCWTQSWRSWCAGDTSLPKRGPVPSYAKIWDLHKANPHRKDGFMLLRPPSLSYIRIFLIFFNECYLFVPFPPLCLCTCVDVPP